LNALVSSQSIDHSVVYKGGAASPPILLAKWVGCNAVDVRNQIKKIIVENVTNMAESTDMK